MQFDLLAYKLTPQELESPIPEGIASRIAIPELEVKSAPNPHAIAWHEAKAAYYLRLISRMMGGRLPIAVRRREISRLHALREAALAELRRLS